MEHFGDFTDYDEGRDIDPREAFYANALPCESCGAPVEERKTAAWDESLQVGPCCEFCLDYEFPDLQVCDQLWGDLDHCKSVSEVQIAMEAHRECCEFCKMSGLEKAA